MSITNVEGCIVNDTVSIKISSHEDCHVETYTAFSPNNDGVNDFWEIGGIEGFNKNIVYIYNRWGDLVNSIDNYNNTDNVWSGENKFTGGNVTPGTYFYIVEAQGTTALSGWVQVVR